MASIDEKTSDPTPRVRTTAPAMNRLRKRTLRQGCAEKDQGGEAIVVEDVAVPDEIEVQHAEEDQPHVAAEEDIRNVFAAAALGAFGKQDDASAEEHGEGRAHFAFEKDPAEDPGEKRL